MKAREVIDAAMADWHAVDAAHMADETFGQLDDDELYRLARRAFVEEWRASLRMKNSLGVPRYASIEQAQPDGSMRRMYKQTAMFTVDDYDAAINSHIREAVSHIAVANSLNQERGRQFGSQLEIPGISESA